MIRRRALVAAARRWDVPVTVVAAPAGFGKSVLVRQAIEDNARDRRGLDHIVTCRPSDRDAGRFTDRVLTELGAPLEPASDTPDARAQAITAALGARSPQSICLVVDDVHELAEGAAGEVLAAVVRDLPGNGHLVLVGRRLPDGVALSRLRATDQLVELDRDDLVFDAGELEELARAYGADPADAAALGGWPALVRLGLTAGRAESMEYLREEILDDLPADLRRDLALAILAGAADDALLGEAGRGTSAAELAGRVPLVDLDGEGRAVPHALWRDVSDRVLPLAETRSLAQEVARRLEGRGEAEEAIELLASVSAWGQAAAAVLRALGRDGVLMPRLTAVRIGDLFPEPERERPELLVLRGVVSRLTVGDRRDPSGRADGYFTEGDAAADALASVPGTTDEAHDLLLRRAGEGFVAAGRPDGAATAVVLRLWSAVDLGDGAAMSALRDEATAIEQQWPGAMGVHARIIDALATWFEGGETAALVGLDAVAAGHLDPPTRAFVELHRAALCLSLGEGGRAIASTHAARAASLEATGAETVSQHVVVSWFTGDPGPALAILDGPQRVAVLSPQDRFHAVAYAHLIGASMELAPPVDVEGLSTQGSGTPRDELLIELVAAAVEVSLGDEAMAVDRARRALEDADRADALVRAEVRRFLTYLYVLLPDERTALDRAELGPLHVCMLALARLVVATREGGRPSWDDMPAAEAAMTWLPLPWSVALAAAAHDAGRSEGRALADLLLDTVGEPARRRLRDIADRGHPAAQALLAAAPAPPPEVVRVRVLGPLDIGHGDAPPSTPRRRRVRELLALLVLRGEVTRDVAMATLWPDLDGDRARNNLNVTVRHLRSELEPARRGGEAPFVLRTTGPMIRLDRSRHVQVDLWESRRQIDQARAHEADGDLEQALVAHRSAVAGWRGEAVADLAYVDVVAGERSATHAVLVEAGCRGAELAVACRQPFVASALAETVLARDPSVERAHRALIAAALASGDEGAARDAVARAEAQAAALGVPLATSTRELARQVGR